MARGPRGRQPRRAGRNLIVDHLTLHEAMPPGRLYESPFTDLTPTGPEALFASEQIEQLISILEAVRMAARAA